MLLLCTSDFLIQTLVKGSTLSLLTNKPVPPEASTHEQVAEIYTNFVQSFTAELE